MINNTHGNCLINGHQLDIYVCVRAYVRALDRRYAYRRRLHDAIQII